MTALSSTQIAQLTAILTGEIGYKRAATKDAAIARFLKVANEKNIPAAETILDQTFEAATASATVAARVKFAAPEAPVVAEELPAEVAVGRSNSRRAALAIAPEVVSEKVKKSKPAKAEVAKPEFRQADKVETTMLDLVKAIGPAKVGAFRAEWIKRDPAGYGKLAPTQQKGIMRKAINKLVASGAVARDGSIFAIKS